MIEDYVVLALSRFGNAVLDRNLCKRYGKFNVLVALKELGFKCIIETKDKTVIARVVK